MPSFAANLSMMFNEVPFLERFGAASEAGFDAVEFLFPYDFPAPEVAAKLKEHDLVQALFNAPPGDWAAGERGISALPDRIPEFRESIEKALEYARALNCSTLHIMAGMMPDPAAYDEMRACYVENIRFAADACQAEGVTVALEPLNSRDVPGYLMPTSAAVAKVVEDVGRPNVGIQFDFYHVQIMEGDLAKRFEALLDDVVHVQISGVPERHEPNIGEINYTYLFNLIDRLGYSGYVGCEYNPLGATLDGLRWLFD
ncbi:MAG: hydroxypyruvate isomerase family protein [Rhodospirillales bacterium]|nr:hydroxypyruvate isomerase family protein [Rhodospirillales bacterium]MBO6785459.1 hydroxypyruvate isomerase family protein [Rhodospirillales bacterium]